MLPYTGICHFSGSAFAGHEEGVVRCAISPVPRRGTAPGATLGACGYRDSTSFF